MNNDSDPRSGAPTPRVDSFEVIDVDCTPLLTDEEKNWPLVALQPRVDSFEATMTSASDSAGTARKAVGAPGRTQEYSYTLFDESGQATFRVTVASGATSDDLTIVIQKLRAAVEEARAATGGRVSIRLDPPSDAA